MGWSFKTGLTVICIFYYMVISYIFSLRMNLLRRYIAQLFSWRLVMPFPLSTTTTMFSSKCWNFIPAMESTNFQLVSITLSTGIGFRIYPKTIKQYYCICIKGIHFVYLKLTASLHLDTTHHTPPYNTWLSNQHLVEVVTITYNLW